MMNSTQLTQNLTQVTKFGMMNAYFVREDGRPDARSTRR